MDGIEEYVNFVCKNLRGNKAEINDMKQEMRSHLLQTVQELKDQGKSEHESIELAINMFGEKNQVKGELAQAFNFQKKIGQVILPVALVLLALGIISLVMLRMTSASTTKRATFLFQEYNKIIDVAKTNNLTLLDNTVKDLFKTNGNQVFYVTLVMLPADFDMENPPAHATTLGKMEYKYPENIKDIPAYAQKLGIQSSGNFFTLENEKKYVEVGVKKGFNDYNLLLVLLIIGVGFCMLYWVLFGIWATINAFHLKRLNVAWVLIFFALNVLGYLLFRFSGKPQLIERVN